MKAKRFGFCLSVLFFAAIWFLPTLAFPGELEVGFVLHPTTNGGYFGNYLACGDINGDGIGDLAVGRSYVPGGRAFVYLGEPGGLNTNVACVVTGAVGSLCFSDVNDDGFDDLLAQSQFTPSTFGTALWYGSSSGFGSALDVSEADWTFSLGYLHTIDDAGDLNGDGYEDIIIGQYGYGGNGLVNEGVVYIFLGSATGLSNAPAQTLYSGVAHAWMGYSISGLGDVNKDGFDDFAVGYADAYRQSDVFLGSADLSGLEETKWSITNASIFGSVVASAGDVNMDGYADWLACCPNYDSSSFKPTAGVARLFLGASNVAGRVDNASIAAWSSEGLVAFDEFGYAATGIGDFNQDGYDDVVVSAWKNDLYGSDEGVVYLFYGTASGLEPGTSKVYSTRQAGAGLGFALCAGEDFNGDGGMDWMASAIYYNSYDGACFAFLGEPPPSVDLIASIDFDQQVTISWPNGSNTVYQVYRSTNLLESFELFNAVIEQVPGTNYVLDTNSLPCAFYRIEATAIP